MVGKGRAEKIYTNDILLPTCPDKVEMPLKWEKRKGKGEVGKAY